MVSLYLFYVYKSNVAPQSVQRILECATVPFIVVYVSQGGSLQVSPE